MTVYVGFPRSKNLFTIQNVSIKYTDDDLSEYFEMHLQYKMFLLNSIIGIDKCSSALFTIQNVSIKSLLGKVLVNIT